MIIEVNRKQELIKEEIMKRYIKILAIMFLTGLFATPGQSQETQSTSKDKQNGSQDVPIISRLDNELFVVSLKNLELSLPLKLKPFISTSEENEVVSVSTGNFMIEHGIFNTETQGLETKKYAADIQSIASFCDADEKMEILKKNFNTTRSQPDRELTINEIRNESFNGYIFFAEDYTHNDKNLIVGLIDRNKSDCYSTSLAVYGVEGIKKPTLLRLVGFLLDDINDSYRALTRVNQPRKEI